MRFVVYDPETKIVLGAFEASAELFPEWPGHITRRYNTGPDDEWTELMISPQQYIVSENGGFHLEKIQNKLKSNEDTV